MGYISEFAKKIEHFRGQGRGESLWNEIFKTDKENLTPPSPTASNTYGRSSISNPAAFKRLLQAMRSMAPGGWSDDRWEQSKHYVGIFYVASHRTGEQMAQSEFQVYQRDQTHPDGKRPVPSNHPLIKLLEKPNEEDSFGDLMYRWNQQMDLTGSALTWMVPNAYDKDSPKGQSIIELYPIPTAIAIPQPAINPDYPDGYYRIQPLYPYGPFSSYPTPSTAVGAPIPAQWMMKFKFPHPLLRYDGYSPMTAMRLHLDEVESIDRSRWYKMKRSVNPEAVLNFDELEGAEPLPEAEIERIRAEFENEQQGPENVGRLYVATPGAKLEPWGTNPKEMDYSSSWDQLVSFTLGGLGITKPAAGMIEDSSYSTLFSALKQFHLLTLEPKCQRIAAKLTRYLAPFFGENLIIEIRCRRIDDHDVKNGKLNLLMQGKAITINELRKELDMPLTSEAWGNDRIGVEEEAGLGVPKQALQQQGKLPSGELGQARIAERTEIPEVMNNKPKPEKLGASALGQRKEPSTNGSSKRF